MRYRKRMASTCVDASLGLAVTTPEALIEELWDVWGSRKRLVTSAQRSMIIAQLLEDQESWVNAPGTIELLEGFLKDYSCYFVDVPDRACSDGLVSADREVLAFIERYHAALDRAGLIEPAEALLQLSDVIDLGTLIVRTQEELPDFWDTFTRNATQQVHRAIPQLHSAAYESLLISEPARTTADEFQSQNEDTRSLTLLKPSGQSAEAYAVWQMLSEGSRLCRAIVITPEPRSLCFSMADALVGAGYAVMLQENVPFARTHFGQAFNAICSLVIDPEHATYEELVEAVRTFLFSPYAQVSSERAQHLIDSVVADRTLSPADMAFLLQAASKSFEFFEGLLEDTDADILLPYFEEIIQRSRLEPYQKEMERSAIASLQRSYHDARELGVSSRTLRDLVQSISVTGLRGMSSTDRSSSVSLVPFADGDASMPQVLFTTLAHAAALPCACCDMVIMTSLDSVHYNGADSRSILTDFIERHQLPPSKSKIDLLEQRFERACMLATEHVVVGYAGQDIDGDERFPAFFLEAYLNAARLQGRPIDERPIGEERFDAAARFGELERDELAIVRPACKGSLDAVDRRTLLKFMQDSEGMLRPVISPSSLETYLSCPYKWFVERNLHLEEREEAFGPREVGTFVHQVFQMFYERWAKEGHQRVEPDDIARALELFDQVFDEVLEAQEGERLHERLISVNERERGRIARLKEQLFDNLRFQQHLFPGYRVDAHEIEIGEEERIVYAGVIVRGRIDRVDLDSSGNYVVVDYKGSINDHEAGFDPDSMLALSEDEQDTADLADSGSGGDLEALSELLDLPTKVQALIYAQALKRRHPDRHPKAAVYLSYKAKSAREVLAGSLSELLFSDASFTKKKSIVHGDFERYLDLVERALERSAKGMMEGDIAPRPHDDHACRYCPVLYCEKRLSGSF